MALSPLLSSLTETDRDCLFSTLHFLSRAALQRALLLAVHRGLDTFAGCGAPAGEVVLGLDGGYVRNRQPRPERTFEIVAGRVLRDHHETTRFAFVREGSASGGETIARLLRQCGTTAVDLHSKR